MACFAISRFCSKSRTTELTITRRREVNLVHLKVEAAAPFAAAPVEWHRGDPVPDGFFRIVELDAATMAALATDQGDHPHVYLLRDRTARESGRVPWGGSDTLRVLPSRSGPRPKLFSGGSFFGPPKLP